LPIGLANKVMRQSRPHRMSDLPAEVVPWRRTRLERAGFAPPLAEALAGDSRIDLHALLELVDRGCPPELSARILAPLDEPESQ
jgi:hypothetical protein